MPFVMNCDDYSSPSQLSLYDVVLYIDDSGSMLEGSKWRDLQAIAQQIVEMTTQFDTDGIQVKISLSALLVYIPATASDPLMPVSSGRVHEQPCACRPRCFFG